MSITNHIDYANGVRAWTRGVPFEPVALEQVERVAALPFVHRVAVMPDVHWGMGATIGSVIPTKGAIIPAAVGVDIGCGMVAAITSLTAKDLPDSLRSLRSDIEVAVPVGFRQHDKPKPIPDFETLELLIAKHQPLTKMSKVHPIEKSALQLGTLGGGNHFIEICLDEKDRVWIMLHSGSRGVGNIIGRYFIEIAKKDMRIHHINLSDDNLAYVSEGTQHFDDYVEAVNWAQNYARCNRGFMLNLVYVAMQRHFPLMTMDALAVNCHHNYVEQENHFGKNMWITRKGAVRVRKGELGIIPGSMGERSFIVEGRGLHPLAYDSCSHGAGRVMSRKQAKREISLEQHIEATRGVECRVDEDVIDESPAAYKDLDAVMAAQSDLVTIKHTLKQILCVKG